MWGTMHTQYSNEYMMQIIDMSVVEALQIREMRGKNAKTYEEHKNISLVDYTKPTMLKTMHNMMYCTYIYYNQQS